MLPNFLYDTYKQYKADTDKIATWLAETAKKCGWIEANAAEGASATNSSKPTKLKGRARKLAREAAAAGKAAPSPSDVGKSGSAKAQKYVVRTKDFVPMAKFIANASDDSLRIPSGFMNLIKRCITTRTGTADWFEKNEEERNEAKGENHMFFVRILSDTLSTLKSRYESQPATVPRPTANDEVIATETLSNKFQDLEVEDLDEEYSMLSRQSYRADQIPSSTKLRRKMTGRSGSSRFIVSLMTSMRSKSTSKICGLNIWMVCLIYRPWLSSQTWPLLL